MATAYIPLPLIGPVLPDGSASNIAAQPQRVKSSASAPSPHFMELLFDAATDEMASWTFQLPGNYASAPLVRLHWKANATANSVVWGCRVAATTPADTDTPNEHAFATTNTATTAVNATEARRSVETTITLTNNDSMVASDTITLQVYRSAGAGGDTCAVDAELWSAGFEYTTS